MIVCAMDGLVFHTELILYMRKICVLCGVPRVLCTEPSDQGFLRMPPPPAVS